MVTTLSVNNRAVAAGVISNARTRMLPTVRTLITTAIVTHTYNNMSKAKTFKPMARAVSRSRDTATRREWNSHTIAMITAPPSATI